MNNILWRCKFTWLQQQLIRIYGSQSILLFVFFFTWHYDKLFSSWKPFSSVEHTVACIALASIVLPLSYVIFFLSFLVVVLHKKITAVTSFCFLLFSCCFHGLGTLENAVWVHWRQLLWLFLLGTEVEDVVGHENGLFLKHFCGTMQSKETGSPGLLVVYGKTARALLFLFDVSHTYRRRYTLEYDDRK